MPKEAKEAQITKSSQEASELESTQEAQEASEQEAEQTQSEKGFFAKVADKAKEAKNELFSTDSSQEVSQIKPAQATPKLKNAISKKTKLIDSLAYQYNGEEDFTLRVGSKVYVIAHGEILIVPNGNTSRWLAHKSTLFTPVI